MLAQWATKMKKEKKKASKYSHYLKAKQIELAKGKVNLLKRFDQSRIETVPDGWAQDSGDENEI